MKPPRPATIVPFWRAARSNCRLFAAVLFVVAASDALATGEIEGLLTAVDRQRLSNYEATRTAALKEARAAGTAADQATLEAVLAKPATSFAGFDMTGSWQCRTIKVGGLVPLVVYGWFRCRVTDDGSGWRLEKLSGSQRTAGRFFTDGDKRLTYLGVGYGAGDRPPRYGSGPPRDQVGYAFRSGEESWRIEFPAPHYESKLDILEFRR